MKRIHKAHSGKVHAKGDKVVWTMSVAEAEEVAEFIEDSTSSRDAARDDVKALRAAAVDADRWPE